MLNKFLSALAGVAVTLVVVACTTDSPVTATILPEDVDRDRITWDLEDGGLQIVTFTNADGYRCTVVGDKADGTQGAPSGSFAMACNFNRHGS